MKRAVATDRPSGTAYEKISATLDREVLRMIRERTDNVSGFLNDAAAERLYWEHIDRSIEQLEREGVRGDQKREDRLVEAFDRAERARSRRRKRAAG